jgi:FixJ family two-component response regulator
MASPRPKTLIGVVDDDPPIRAAIRRLLSSAGYAVNTFSGGQELLASLRDCLPQCLVVDVHMAEMTGLALRDRLRELGYHVPVILITANDTPQVRVAASQGGTSGLLIKPFKGSALLAAVAQAVASGSGGSPASPPSGSPRISL